MLSQSRNFIIEGGNFLDIQGDYRNGSLSGLGALKTEIVTGAFHDSFQRYPPPKCHPQTRKAVINIICQWIADTASATKLFWLFGPAGAGKSAIAQTVAESCESEKALAASFFFSRSSEGRNDASRFVPTIAYQLLLAIPDLKPIIEKAVESDPAIFTRSIHVQMRVLIIQPVLSSDRSKPWPLTIIIDGLDECQDPKMQCQVLHIIANASQSLPFRFVVTSRPEPDICDTFELSHINSVTHRLMLDDSFHPDEDIETFLRSGFSEIKLKHRHMTASSNPQWPTCEMIGALVAKASGQFIYASTVLKFVDDRHHDPIRRLGIILGTNPAKGGSPYADLDCLYSQILSSVPDISQTRRILGAIVVIYSSMCPSDLGRLLNLSLGDIYIGLSHLHSIIRLPEPSDYDNDGIYLHASFSDFITGPLRSKNNDYIHLLHASFTDFLMDPLRSKNFFVDSSEVHSDIASCCLNIINSHTQTSAELTDYITQYWRFHCSASSGDNRVLQALREFDFGEWLASRLSIFDQRMSSKLHFMEWLTRQNDSEFYDLHQKFWNIIDTTYRVKMNECPDSTTTSLILSIVQERSLSFKDCLDILNIDPTILRKTVVRLGVGIIKSNTKWIHEEREILPGFLENPNRSGIYHTTTRVHAIIAYKYWRYITKSADAVRFSYISPRLSCEIENWISHTEKASPSPDLVDSIQKVKALNIGSLNIPVRLDFTGIDKVVINWAKEFHNINTPI